MLHFRSLDTTSYLDSLMRVERSDEIKGFSFRLLPGLWELEGMAEGYIPSKPSAFRQGQMWVELKYELEVASGKTNPECPLIVELTKSEPKKAIQFLGTIHLPSGEPAPHAFVAYPGGIARSDSEGRYETEPIFTSSPRTVDGVQSYRFTFEIHCQNRVAYETVLLPDVPELFHQDLGGRSLSGFVRDVRGKPVEGASVIVGYYHDPLGKRAAKREAVLRAPDGGFSFAGLIPRSDSRRMRSVTLRAQKTVETGGAPEKYEGRARVWIPDKDPIEDFDIVIARVGPVISGTVSYHDGTTMRNDHVSMRLYGDGGQGGQLTDFARHLDDRGRFCLEGRGFFQEIDLAARERGETDWQRPSTTLFPETFRLSLRTQYAVEGSTVRLRTALTVEGLTIGMTDVDIRFPPMGSIRARVVDGESGLPVESFSLNAGTDPDYETWPQGTSWSQDVESFQTIRGGEFHLADLVPGPYGTYRLNIHTRAYCDPAFREVRVAGNQTTDLGDIPLCRNWWGRGRVVAAGTGEPLAATITGPRGVTASTDDSGDFVLAMHRNTRSCKLKVTPVDDTWEETEVGGRFGWQPTVDLGDIQLKAVVPE